MKKNHEVRVKLTNEEYEKIKKKADSLGLCISTYIRTMALISRISTETPT